MAGVESEIYENDVELPKYSEKPQYASLRPNNQESGKPVVAQRKDNTSPVRSQSKWTRYFAIAVTLALGIIIILTCVIIAIVVTKVNQSDETKETDEEYDNDPTDTEPSLKDIIPLRIFDMMPKNCKQIKDLKPQAKSGNYLIRIEGTERILLVYCDHETSDGGWTLVYSYGFTNYESFNAASNAVTPIPNWDVANNNVKVSTLTPKSEDERGAMDFSYWRFMGTEFLVKSNINNWIRCSPSGGNLAEWKFGNIRCDMVKVIQECPTGNTLPVRLIDRSSGPYLTASYTRNSSFAYYFFEGQTNYTWPVHDPCGKSGRNHKMFVQNPYGAIFFR